MLFEHRNQPLLALPLWRRRVARSLIYAAILISLSLTIGICGYHYLGQLPWIDALLDASMILGGMGPVAPMTNDAIKIFASCYALYSGLILIGATGIILAPWLHRLLHKFHAEIRDNEK